MTPEEINKVSPLKAKWYLFSRRNTKTKKETSLLLLPREKLIQNQCFCHKATPEYLSCTDRAIEIQVLAVSGQSYCISYHLKFPIDFNL